MGIKVDTLNYIEQNRLMWYGYVRRADGNRCIAKVTERSPTGKRKRGRSRRSWRNKVNESMERRGLEDGGWQDRYR